MNKRLFKYIAVWLMGCVIFGSIPVNVPGFHFFVGVFWMLFLRLMWDRKDINVE